MTIQPAERVDELLGLDWEHVPTCDNDGHREPTEAHWYGYMGCCASAEGHPLVYVCDTCRSILWWLAARWLIHLVFHCGTCGARFDRRSLRFRRIPKEKP